MSYILEALKKAERENQKVADQPTYPLIKKRFLALTPLWTAVLGIKSFLFG